MEGLDCGAVAERSPISMKVVVLPWRFGAAHHGEAAGRPTDQAKPAAVRGLLRWKRTPASRPLQGPRPMAVVSAAMLTA